MEVNIIVEDVMTIEDVVSKWDISEELKRSKIEVLESWREKINDAEKFELLLRICNKFEYYSKKLTADTYKFFFEDARNEHKDFDSFLESTLFTPLRTRERLESSVDMLAHFRLANKIDAASTYVEGPVMFIRRYRKFKEDLKKHFESIEEEKTELKKKVGLLNTDLQKIEDGKVKKKIRKRIIEMNTRLLKLDETLKKLANDYKKYYYYVRNIVIIDDFIGTGSSGKKLIRRLAQELEGTDIDISFYLWILETSDIGIEEIERLAKSLGVKLKVKFKRISLNVLEGNEVFSSDELQIATKEINSIQRNFNIPRSRYSKNHALASFVNAPNNNLALLSNESNQWRALFLRIKRVEKDRKVIDNNELKDIMKDVMGR